MVKIQAEKIYICNIFLEYINNILAKQQKKKILLLGKIEKNLYTLTTYIYMLCYFYNNFFYSSVLFFSKFFAYFIYWTKGAMHEQESASSFSHPIPTI